MSRAKGSNMHHMRTWVIRNGGDAAWEAVVTAMAPEDEAELRALVPVGWYSLALQHRLLATLEQNFGPSSVEHIGAYEAEQDLTVVHRLFLRLANPVFVMQKARDYWGRFYTSGEWTVTPESRTSAVATLENLDPWDDRFARYLTAYVRRMWQLVGAKDVEVSSRVDRGTLHLRGRWR
ncbi:MAG: hypothetical protein AB8I08_40910 [Sandaracinaceae bacterium]